MKIFIGCSSKETIPEKYKEDCTIYLDQLFQQDYDLVFGAMDSSLMGIAYHQALKNHRKITGICPFAYQDDFKSLQCHEEYVTKTVNERTESLIQNSDVLLFLPGGIGTIHELFAAIESKRCHEFDKPIIIYNSCGFFDLLFSFLEFGAKDNFTPKEIMDSFYVSNSIEDTIRYIESNYKQRKLKK